MNVASFRVTIKLSAYWYYFRGNFSMKRLTGLIFSALSFASFAVPTPVQKVIYDEDNRLDMVETLNAKYIELSRSTAAQIDNAILVHTYSKDNYRVVAQTLQQIGICPTERFSHQVAGARCSGFLVGKDLLVTAGNCVKNLEDCANYSWVFGYEVKTTADVSVTVSSENIFHCKEILTRSLDNATRDDFALIRLDREVKNRNPLNFRRTGVISDDANVFVIGHPIGLPTKVADGAKVRNNQPEKYFVTNLDTYGGNSGSAVFNADTFEVEGIFARGEDDFVYNPNTNCSESKVCKNDSCRGEDVTRITNFKILKSFIGR